MLLDDFGPYVMPYVIGCSHPLMTMHARLAAIKFCTETKCFVRPLDAFTMTGGNLLEIEPDDQQIRLLDITSVTVSGINFPIVGNDIGARKVQSDDTGTFCFHESLSEINIYPAQARGTEVVVRAVMVPTVKATKLDDTLQEHIESISFGAIASLMRVPGQSFSNIASDSFEAMFRERIRTESSRLARGSIAVSPRAIPSFI